MRSSVCCKMLLISIVNINHIFWIVSKDVNALSMENKYAVLVFFSRSHRVDSKCDFCWCKLSPNLVAMDCVSTQCDVGAHSNQNKKKPIIKRNKTVSLNHSQFSFSLSFFFSVNFSFYLEIHHVHLL